MINGYRYEDGLESDRLVTRFLNKGDFESWLPFFESEEATMFTYGFGLTTAEEKTEYWLERQLLRYEENRYGLQAIIDRQTGKFLGQCGLLIQEVDGVTELEVGYHFLPEVWGKGYAPEAARIFMKYAEDNHLADSIISIIDVNNLKSQRVAEKNGLIRQNKTHWMVHDVYIYRHIFE